jgi:hypothetical protein
VKEIRTGGQYLIDGIEQRYEYEASRVPSDAPEFAGAAAALG